MIAPFGHRIRQTFRVVHRKFPVLSAYAAQLVDSFGRKLPDSSVARLPSLGGSVPFSSSVCGGSLTMPRPLYGSFCSRIYLPAVDLKIGMFRDPSSGSFPVYCPIAAAILNVKTLSPQLNGCRFFLANQPNRRGGDCLAYVSHEFSISLLRHRVRYFAKHFVALYLYA